MSTILLVTSFLLSSPLMALSDQCGGFCYTDKLSNNLGDVAKAIVETREYDQNNIRTLKNIEYRNRINRVEGLAEIVVPPQVYESVSRERNRGHDCAAGSLRDELASSIENGCRVRELSQFCELRNDYAKNKKDALLVLKNEFQRKLKSMNKSLYNKNVKMTVAEYERVFMVLHKNLIDFVYRAKKDFFDVVEKNNQCSSLAEQTILRPQCSDVYNTIFPKYKENLVQHCRADDVRSAVKEFAEEMKTLHIYVQANPGTIAENDKGFLSLHERSRYIEVDIARTLEWAVDSLKSVEETLKTFEKRRMPASKKEDPLTGKLLGAEDIHG